MSSIYAISAVESMEVGAYCFTWRPKSQLHMASQVLSLKYDICVHMATFYGGEDCDFFWELGQAKKLNSILNTIPPNIFAWHNQDLTLLNVNLISMIFRGSKVGTLSPYWDSLTWVGLGSWDPMWTSPKVSRGPIQTSPCTKRVFEQHIFIYRQVCEKQPNL